MLRVLLVLLLLNMPAAAQLDPDRAWTCWSCYSHNAHFPGRAATDVAVRPPAVPRAVLADGVRVRSGFGAVDLTYDLGGAIAMEIVLPAARHLWRALHRM